MSRLVNEYLSELITSHFVCLQKSPEGGSFNDESRMSVHLSAEKKRRNNIKVSDSCSLFGVPVRHTVSTNVLKGVKHQRKFTTANTFTCLFVSVYW